MDPATRIGATQPRPGGIAPCDAPAPGRGEWVLALVGVLVLTDLFDRPLYAAFGFRATVLPELPIARLLLLGVFVVAAVLLSADRRGAADRVRATWVLWPAVAFAFVSAIWSQQLSTTLVWAAALLGTSAFGVALAVRFSPGAQAALVAAAVGIIALTAVLSALLWPALGVDPLGRWTGAYLQKNQLGRVMALGVAAAAVAALRRRQAPALVALLLCAGVLAASRSRASVLAALIAAGAVVPLLAARAWRRHAAAILVGGAAATIFIVAVLVVTGPGLALLARDDTLTDRTAIWRAVGTIASETPWIGHGYGAFWPSQAGQRAVALIGVEHNHAHNGAVDLFAELGVAGLVLVLVPLAMFSAAALRHALQPGARACLWPAVYLVFFIASNAAESALFRHKVYWALYVAVACHLSGYNGTHAPRGGFFGDGAASDTDARRRDRTPSANRRVSLRVRAGLHALEIVVREDGDLTGLAVSLAARFDQLGDIDHTQPATFSTGSWALNDPEALENRAAPDALLVRLRRLAVRRSSPLLSAAVVGCRDV